MSRTKLRTWRHMLFYTPVISATLVTCIRLTYLIGPPTGTAFQIRIGVEKTDTTEIRKTQDHRQIIGISDELRVVQHDNGLADGICTRRKVDDSGGSSL
jgi:hypothetical protein